MIQTFLNGLQLPVNPLEGLSFSVNGANQKYEIAAIGDVTHIGNRGLISFSIDSIFTDKQYPWLAVSNPLSAAQYIEYIYDLMAKKQPIRFIVTGIGNGADINMLCSIESFKHKQQHGEMDEYYYSLGLQEYREYGAKKVSVNASGKLSQQSSTRMEQSQKQASYTVREGDTLWTIAKQLYGDGAKWESIAKANPNKAITAGEILSIP